MPDATRHLLPRVTARCALTATTLVVIAAVGASSSVAQTSAQTFTNPTRIDNRYLPLTAHRRCEMRGRADDGTRERSVRTVLKRTKIFDVGGQRVTAAVIQDNDYEDGKLVETTLDYFAQADDGTVYYLGEQVKNLKSGRVVDTKGTWLFGKDTDRMGVAMPAEPKLGQQWHFEDVPGLTTESNRVEEIDLRTKVAGRVMTDVIRVQEFIQPQGSVEYKLYASGVGSVAEYQSDARVTFAGCR